MRGDQIAECIDTLTSVAERLHDAANALEAIADVVEPQLPIGSKELFEVAEYGIFSRMHGMEGDIERVVSALKRGEAQS